MPIPHSKEIAQLRNKMIIVHDIARDQITHSQEKHLFYKNRGTKERSFEVGDKVLMRTHILSDKSKGISSGLAPKREGPFFVTEKVSRHVYNLENRDTKQAVYKVHINDLTPFHGSN